MKQSGEEEGLREIALRRSRWIEAINSGNPDDFVSVLMDEAVWLPWGQTAIQGKDNIRNWIQEPFSEYEYDYEVHEIRVRFAGEWAIERARFRTKAVGRDGVEAPTHDGVYTILWRQMEPEGWLIDRYIDHTGFDGI
jgi:uncharacterized protein (TIGR02246 family)